MSRSQSLNSFWYGFAAVTAVLVHSLAGDPRALAEEYKPAVQPASDEGRLAIEGFKVPEGIKVQLFAAEPDIANPVAFCFDEQGRLLVAETYRQGKGVEDNRGHMDWLERDLSLQSVEERREMFREFLGEKVADYGVEHDRIRLIHDTNGDGQADVSTVFADGFNDIATGTGAGVLSYRGDVYYTCIPELWKLRDTNHDGIADERTALHTGYGVRVAFRGHDMHGLVIGPDGRLYYSIGDRGYNVETPEGETLARPDTGAVFRCELDGSNLEVFAYGVRNPQELAFDDYGNLFTGDNNSDSGDQARWVQVVEGADIGWRMYYQYLSDRGPWNRERMWYPYRADDETTAVQPAYIVPPIANISDGPSGLVAYPGVGLADRYKGHFFLADFRGSAGRSGVRSFAVEPRGASFELVDSHWFLEAILATDVDFGWDGKLYVSDWVDGWYGPGKGRIYTFTDSNAAPTDSANLMAGGIDKMSPRELVALLSHADRRVRQEAQFSLVRQNAVDILAEAARESSGPFSRLHAVWGLGQLLRQGEDVAGLLLPLLSDDDAEVRAQVARVLGDARTDDACDGLIEQLASGTPREQYFAAIALGRLECPDAAGALLELLQKNNDVDPVVRHAGVMGIVGTATPSTLVELATHPAVAVRRGAVLALRRLGSPEIAAFLGDADPQVMTEAIRAIHDEPIAEALPQVAALADRPGLTDAALRRVMNANFRLGGESHAAAVAALAGDARLSESLRLEAVDELLLWDAPPPLDRVTNEYRPLETSSRAQVASAVRGCLASLLADSDKLRSKGIQLAAKYGIDEIGPEMVRLASHKETSPEVRAEALSAAVALKVDMLGELVERALADDEPALRAAALKALPSVAAKAAVEKLATALSAPTKVERQAALAALASIEDAKADIAILAALDEMASGKIADDIQLDLMEIARRREDARFNDRLEKIEASWPADDPIARFRICLTGGDAERGAEIFFGNAAASCRRCHKVNGSGSDVGPDLSAVAKDKPREYLLESIVNPNAKIAKGFETVVFAMESGLVYSGIVRGEDEESYRLVTPTGEVIIVPKAEIEARATGKSGMPDDIVKQLSLSQIRDLVEYLSQLKTPAADHGHAE